MRHHTRIAFVVGLWLIAAPVVLGYPAGEPVANDLVLGVLISVIALAPAGPRTDTALSLLGAWLCFGAIWIYGSVTPLVNDLACGVVVSAAALAALIAREERECGDSHGGASGRTRAY